MGWVVPPPPPSLLDIARRRYVNGDIDVEDFELACDHLILGRGHPVPVEVAFRVYGPDSRVLPDYQPRW